AIGIFHLFNHAFFKALLFLAAGSVIHAVGSNDMRVMGGLHSKMKITSITMLFGALALSGIPPFSGFWSKLIIIVATIRAGHPAVAAVAIAMAFVTLAYYVKVQREMIFGPVRGPAERAKEVPAAMYVPLIILAIVCVGFGLLYPVWGSRILEPARDALLNGAEYVKLVLG
ncbi:MAG: hypothetical protein KAW67_10635, partial [Candidatus Eisenbacteria sp.]|nr:hypothetical protein [Candidatus Eisenbacteria bacterium]